jgi:hypothetical protein
MKFSPSDVEDFTGWPPESQRDLRRRGLLSSYGQQTVGGHWRYNLRDLLAFYIAGRLHSPSMEGLWLTTLLATSWKHAPTFLAELRGRGEGKHLIAFPQKRDRHVGTSGSEVIVVSNLAELEEADFDDMHVINVKRLAETSHPSIKALAREVND